MQAKALECSENRIASPGYGSVGIEIIDSECPDAVAGAGLEEAGEGGEQRTDM